MAAVTSWASNVVDLPGFILPSSLSPLIKVCVHIPKKKKNSPCGNFGLLSPLTPCKEKGADNIEGVKCGVTGKKGS